MLSPQTWFWVTLIIGGSCAIGSIITVIIVLRNLRRGSEDGETPEIHPFDAVPGDEEARLQEPGARSGGAQVVAPVERGENLRMERIPMPVL